MSRVRVLHFINSFAVGGTERHVINLLRAHDDSRFDASIGCLGQDRAFAAELAGTAGRIADFPISRLYGPATWRQQLRLAAHLRARRMQIVHSYGFYANCFAIPAARLAGVPAIVASIRDTGAGWTDNQKRFERWILRMTDSIMTNADAVRELLAAQGCDPDKITVIPNGIDIERFAAAGAKSSLRADFDIPADARLVGVIARIDAVKGLEYFVDAAGRVARSHPDVRFVIVGHASQQPDDQEYLRMLRNRSREHGLEGRLVFTGNRTDVPGVLAELDISVLPSLTEGLPNAVLEAMAAGTPVIATRVGGVPEIIEYGTTGLLVPPRDAEALAGAIARTLDQPDLAQEWAKRARQQVMSQYSRERMARRTEDHYLELLRRRAGRGAKFPEPPLNAGERAANG